MSIVEFKEACKAHRAVCPYKATGMTKCGANIDTPDGKCPRGIEECHYMAEFKRLLRQVAKTSQTDTKN